ncbi:MAG: hypothetical protein JXQ71_16990 [Verrucomicrobia bacterium]|nr:hypothetical protein [Verrucomicrobiota bacterium]
MAALTEAHKAALKRFRELRKQKGGDPGKAAAQFRQERKAVESALKRGPATVPELARASGLPAHKVLWHLAGMRKYGTAQETAQDGDYPKYASTLSPAEAPAPAPAQP